MEKIAIMVDAGYLMSACFALQTGQSRGSRKNMILDPEELFRVLSDTARSVEPSARILRMYWYDGAIASDKLTDEQRRIGIEDYCKLRLGSINSNGIQKGVDTLIVLDLLSLSENRAASSILLIAGDEDVLAAVEIAQQRGVAVHLLGIDDPAHPNQSARLMRECDTCSNLPTSEISKFFAILDSEGKIATSDAKNRETDVQVGSILAATVRNIGWDNRVYFHYDNGSKKAMMWPDRIPKNMLSNMPDHFAEGITINVQVVALNSEGALVTVLNHQP